MVRKERSPSLSNILPSVLLQRPKTLRLLLSQIPLTHSNINQRLLNTLAHALTTPTNKHASIQTINDKPDQIRLRPNFILYVFPLLLPIAFTGLYHFLHFIFVYAPFSAIEFVEKGIAHALEDPDFIRTVRVL